MNTLDAYCAKPKRGSAPAISRSLTAMFVSGMVVSGIVGGMVVLEAPCASAQTVRRAAGIDAAAIQSAVDAFRTDLGANNGLGPCTGGCLPGVGRREVNWDAVPDAFASPNAFPGNFFNQPAGSPAGRVRGIEFTTTGVFEVSSNAASGVPILFGNHDPQNAVDFAAFSPERIFGIVGSNQLDVTFSVPGSPGTPALVRGFGAVFTDVELANSVRLEIYGANNTLLDTVQADFIDAGGGDTFKSFSFAGISYPTAVVRRVHIVNGGFDLNLQAIGVNDATAMDDYFFGEPVAVPEPVGLTLCGLATAACFGRRRRQRARR